MFEILIWNSEASDDSSEKDSYAGQIFDVAVICNIWTFNLDEASLQIYVMRQEVIKKDVNCYTERFWEVENSLVVDK